MSKSLDELVSNLNNNQCMNLRQFYEDEEYLKLMLRKGLYPYEFMDSFYRKLKRGMVQANQQVWSRIGITPEFKNIILKY